MKVINSLLLLLTASGTDARSHLPFKVEKELTFNNGRKIVGGTPVREGRYPFQAFLANNDRIVYCGGSLISPSVVLTAAHCLDVNVGGVIPFFVGVGCFDLNNIETPGCELIGISDSAIFPGYDAEGNSGDYGIVTLETASTNPPVTLALPGLDFDSGNPLTVIGWGRTSVDGSPSRVLLEVEVPFVASQTCADAYDAELGEGFIDNTMICAGEPGKDSCQGDSGGPLFLNCNGDDVQVGVVSFGISCAEEFPGVYGDVRFEGAVDFIADAVTAQGESLTTFAEFCSGAYQNSAFIGAIVAMFVVATH